MKRIALIYVCLACVLAGCSRTGGVTQENRAISPALQSRAENLEPSKGSALQTQIEQIAALAKGRVGVAAVVLEAGETIASLNPQDHFPMQSVYKLPISLAVMKQVDAGRIKLEQKVRLTKADYVGGAAHSPIRDKYPEGTELTVTELIRFALSESDGTASDALMNLAGGPEAIQAYLSKLGIKDLQVVDTEKSFAEDHSLQFKIGRLRKRLSCCCVRCMNDEEDYLNQVRLSC
jgi:beta-lactamase class A